MEFIFNGEKYYICREYKDCYNLANYIYKDRKLIFVDYIGKDLKQSIALFKIINNKNREYYNDIF